MTNLSRMIGRSALTISTALAIGAAMPAFAAPGADGGKSCHPMAGRGGMTSLTVTGEGEARIAPDMASIQLGVTTQAEGAAEAMSQNSTRQSAVIEALGNAGIEDKDIQTSGLNLSPVMDYGDGRAPTVTGYQASNMVSIRVREVEKLGEVLDAIVGAGANEINGINFMREDGSDAEDDARRAAVEDARHKAEVLAEAAGLSLGPILLLRDTPSPEGPQPMMMRAQAAADAGGVPIAAGELSMTAQVEMEFAMVGDGACVPMRGHGKPHGGPDAQPPAGDLPPPEGIDQGAPAPGEAVVPLGENPDGVAPATDGESSN
ncbi:SIMPL domain-containing protein [Paracoccus caeni]|uniref:SIMPL domain-containing protein n=1 Tax=Paracoccus caeni TaxID=657651 RepID=A0A934SIS0_9RHOB|nr:SIMPL domain-containing protein [Paracoccus caeni]MBK4215203.1 SIMPL domain-containing protein [Paracoccus caeni]